MINFKLIKFVGFEIINKFTILKVVRYINIDNKPFLLSFLNSPLANINNLIIVNNDSTF